MLKIQTPQKSAIYLFYFLHFFVAIIFPATTQTNEAIGTSTLLESKVWFTLRDGILSAAQYPNLTTNNLSSLYFVVTDGKTFALSERDSSVTKQFIQTNPNSLSYRQISTDRNHKFTLTKTYCAYPDFSTVLTDVDFQAPKGFQLYVVFDPAIANTEGKDTAAAFGGQGAFSVYEGNICSALIADKGFAEMSADLAGANDGLQTILRRFKLTKPQQRADNGNVICVAHIKQPKHFLLALAFADTPEKALVEAEHCLEANFKDTLADYEKGWSDWLKTIGQNDRQSMFRKAHEEK